jgi:thioredoxin 2
MSDLPRHVVCPSCGAVNRISSSQPTLQAKCGKCHLPLFQGKPVVADEAAFERHITRNDIPVLVDFWASWCQPCLAMAPAYERAAAELEPDFRLLKVNADEAQQVVAKFAIRSIPTLMLFVRGRPIAQTSGALDTRRITEWAKRSAMRS